VKDAAAEAGREVKEAVRTQINERAPEVKQAVQDAGMTVKEQVKESAKKVKKEAKDAATEPGTGTNPRSTA
jgi:TRAP-type C4-dicarboxylate transport system substrate-binding protein